MSREKYRKLLDAWPDGITDGIFVKLQNKEVPWHDENIAQVLDVNYYYNHSGEKIISNLVEHMVSEDGTLSPEAKQTICDIVYNINKENWERTWKALVTSKYSPIENVDGYITEEHTHDNTATQNGTNKTAHTGSDTHTGNGTDNLTTGGTDGLFRHGTDNHSTSDDLTNGVENTNDTLTKSGTEAVTKTGTETNTKNGTEEVAKTGEEKNTKDGTEYTQKTGTETNTKNGTESTQKTGTENTTKSGTETLTDKTLGDANDNQTMTKNQVSGYNGSNNDFVDDTKQTVQSSQNVEHKTNFGTGANARTDTLGFNNRKDELSFNNRNDTLSFQNRKDETGFKNRSDTLTFTDRKDTTSFNNRSDTLSFQGRKDETSFTDRTDSHNINRTYSENRSGSDNESISINEDTTYGKTENRTLDNTNTDSYNSNQDVTIDVTNTDNGKETTSTHRHGNIGVTTNQQMIEEELRLRQAKKSFYELVFADIDRYLTIPIY